MFLKMYISEEKNYATLHKNRKTSFVITVGPRLSGFYVQKKVLEKIPSGFFKVKLDSAFFNKSWYCNDYLIFEVPIITDLLWN